jgi:hypothetical protein
LETQSGLFLDENPETVQVAESTGIDSPPFLWRGLGGPSSEALPTDSKVCSLGIVWQSWMKCSIHTMSAVGGTWSRCGHHICHLKVREIMRTSSPTSHRELVLPAFILGSLWEAFPKGLVRGLCVPMAFRGYQGNGGSFGDKELTYTPSRKAALLQRLPGSDSCITSYIY